MKNNQAAIDNLEAMLDPSLGVDAVLIGPHDLSCNLGTTQIAHNSLGPISNLVQSQPYPHPCRCAFLSHDLYFGANKSVETNDHPRRSA